MRDVLESAIEMRDVLEINPNNYTYGLCEVLCRGYDTAVLWPLFTRWPEFSGNSNYPIRWPGDPAGRGQRQAAEDAYYRFPRWTGEYGAARLRLLDFIISELEKELGDEPTISTTGR